jgi:lysophospholipase L1-like esterase
MLCPPVSRFQCKVPAKLRSNVVLVSTTSATPASRHVGEWPRRFVFGLWFGFMVLLVVGVVGGAEVGLRLRRHWIAAHLAVPPNEDPRFVADRMVRYRNRPSYTYESQIADGSMVHYTNNSLGFRGPEINRAKPAGMSRVIVVGGSTVYGALDDDPATLTRQLEAVLRRDVGPNIQVINAGVPGYVALDEVASVCADLLDLQPDVVVVVDGLNDMYYGTLEEWPAQIATNQLGMLADGRCPEIPAMVDRTTFPFGLLKYHAQMLARDARGATFRQLRMIAPPAPRIVSENIIDLHAAALGLVAQYGRERGVAVIAALQPLVAVGNKRLSPAEIAAIDHEGYWDVGGWAELAKVMYARFAMTTDPAVEASGGAFVDLSGAFDGESGTTYAADAVHYTALGQQRLAEALAPLVEQRLSHGSGR